MNFRRNIAAILLLMVCIAWVPAADAAKRVALVIGNDTYATLPDLNNGRTDAKGMAAKLRSLGFDVILKQDVSRRGLSRALADFEGRLKDAEVGLVFYAGHGIQADGTNYLVPSDAKIEIEDDLRYEGIKADDFLEVMERAGTPLNIVILDACRDNPLPRRTRSAARGLTVPVIPKGIKGTAIVYSAAPGQTAQDGPKGGHGVFTGELLKVLDRPGLTLEKVFKETATRVAAATNGRQDPWLNSSVKGDFFFSGKAAPVSSRPATAKTLDLEFWQSIRDSDDSTMFEAYLEQHPTGAFAPLAKAKIAALKRKQVAVARPLTTKPKPAAKKAVGVYPKSYKPGKTFRDCPDCPEMVVIPPGSFRMGDLSGDGDSDEKPVHEVRIGYSFAVGKYEVTQDEWVAVMGSNPSRYKGGRNPVEQVSWSDAKAFVGKLSAKTGKGYRLLSESEWEYMARAGTSSAFYTGSTISPSQANFDGNSTYNGSSKGEYRKRTVAVGSFGANKFGVHDVHGNVLEWVEDCSHNNYSGAPNDGGAWTTGGNCSVRVLRGGSWYNFPQWIRSADRYRFHSSRRYSYIGLRIARTLKDTERLFGKLQQASLTAPAIQIVDMDATFVVVKTSNLRAKPSAQSKKVGQLAIDTGVSVTGKVKGKKWYRIAHAGGTAFVFAPLIKQVDAQQLADWEKVKSSKEASNFDAFLKAHPDGHFAERAKGLLAALKPSGKLQRAKTEVGPTESLSAFQPGMYVVSVSSAGVHLLPSSNSSTIDDFHVGRAVNVVDVEGKFYKVLYKWTKYGRPPVPYYGYVKREFLRRAE